MTSIEAGSEPFRGPFAEADGPPSATRPGREGGRTEASETSSAEGSRAPEVPSVDSSSNDPRGADVPADDLSPGAGSPLARLLDAFLQPRNIKWLLVAGVLILLASSLMLVAAHWNNYVPTLKYLVLLGYTAGTWLAGRWCVRRLALPRTGTVVLALTTLLLPVTFLGLNLVGRTGPPAAGLATIGAAGVAPHVTGTVWAGLFLLNLAVAAVAARDVFRHFLRGDQLTFLAAYLLLSAAGAFASSGSVPGSASTSEAGSVLVGLGLWAAFAVGAVKVNRHVFWLVEDRRLPRVFGFFPILLLGGQFLALFALGPAHHLPVQWMGLGLGLVAAVVLATADAVAGVFQLRTGDLVRPLPWAIVSPVLVGLVMCVAALCVAGTGLVPPGKPLAATPTAALVAVLLALVARRTRQSAFVWAALVVATLAYNFAPAFFADLARAAVARGAAAVNESRLPIPFYGLTYLPLLTAMLVVGAVARRKGWALVETPVRRSSFGLACLLLIAGLGHPKAAFPVAAAMTVVLAAQSATFRVRLPGLIGVAAFVVAAAGLAPFLRGVAGADLAYPTGELLSLAAAALALLAGGGWVDRRLATLGRQSADTADEARGDLDWRGWANQACRLASLSLSILLALAWVTVVASPTPLVSATETTALAVAVAGLLSLHALWWVRVELSVLAVAFVHAALCRWAFDGGWPIGSILSLATLASVGQWAAGGLLLKRPAWRVSRAFVVASRGVAGVELVVLLVGFHLPMAWAHAVDAGRAIPTTALPWTPVAAIVAIWACRHARRMAQRPLAALGCLTLLGAIGAGLVDLTGSNDWLPVVTTAASVAGVLAAAAMRRRATLLWNVGEVAAPSGAEADGAQFAARGWVVLAGAAEGVALVFLAAAAAASLVVFTGPIRAAGFVAAGGLCLAASLGRHRRDGWRSAIVALVNWQAVSALLAAACGTSHLTTILDLASADLVAASLPVAALSAASLVGWLVWGGRADRRVAVGQAMLLRSAVGLGLLFSIGRVGWASVAFGPVNAALAVVAFAGLVASELLAACRTQRAGRVWSAMALTVVAGAYLALVGMIRFGGGLSLYVPLATAVALRVAGLLASRRPTAAVLAGPFYRTAGALPLATVVAALARHLFAPHAGWLGAGSLALFLSAGFYFWRGLDRRQRRWHVLAAGIANLSLALLWRDLSLADPQFYLVPLGASVLLLVQLLRREIPERLHDPLRYAGALVVLVSPTFHIVGGSWVHLLSLMVLSVAVMLAAIGLRVRALLYAGSAFLAADLIAMVIRGFVDEPSLLWLAGLAVGAGVIALGALAERHRERLLQRVRVLSATLSAWS